MPFNERKSPSRTMYGPNLPIEAVITLPVAGSMPTTRGKLKYLNASATVTFEGSMVLGIDAIFGFTGLLVGMEDGVLMAEF